jgi:putative DNA primase/helicase
MKHLVPDDEFRHYVLQILAYPIAYPGAKLNLALVFKGTTGAGKGSLSEILMDLYGEANCSKIGNRELGSTFNGFMAYKQFIVCEEIKGNGNIRPDSEAMKDWITGKTALVNEKYEKARPVRNVANFILLSNDRLPVFVANNDRRYVVVDIQNKFGDERGKRLNAWSKDGGVSFVRYYLEHDVDFAGFSPTADARTSPAKVDVISAGRSAIERFAYEIMKDEERPGFITNRELYQLADVQLSIW